MGTVTFRLTERIVLEHMAKDASENREKTQTMNDTAIQKVFPDLTAPSHIIASQSLNFEFPHHQVSKSICFFEKGLSFIRRYPAVF